MFCVQGSDAHRLIRESEKSKDLGLGDRITEILLPEISFAAIKAVFEGNDFNKVRPFQATESKLAQVLTARDEGDSRTQVFHERLGKSRRRTNAIYKDVVALANTDGGEVFVGLSSSPKAEIVGVPRVKTAADQLREDFSRFITPEPPITIEMLSAHDRDLLVVTVSSGTEKPYALTSGEIYVRDGANTTIANRDQIVEMVRSVMEVRGAPTEAVAVTEPPSARDTPKPDVNLNGKGRQGGAAPVPRTGVEIVSSELRDGVVYHTMRDLRNSKLVEKVTHDSARRLWRYAIEQRESGGPDAAAIDWNGSLGVVRVQKQRNGTLRYDLAYREDGQVRVFYGVTDSGLPDDWKPVLEQAVAPKVAA
jgi:hypothetical protein